MVNRDQHLELPRGLHDVPPEVMATHSTLRQQWFDTCSLAGYQPVAIPPLGFTTTFTTGHNAAGNKLFRFPDRRGRDLALVSDSLPALLRLARARGLPEQRLSYCCPISRYERRPRRHYHLLGMVEVIDRPTSPDEDSRAVARLATTVGRFLAPHLPVTATITDPGLWHVATEGLTDTRRDLVNAVRTTDPHSRPRLLREAGAAPDIVRIAESLAEDPTGESIRSCDATFHDRVDRCRELADTMRGHRMNTTVDLGELHASEFHNGPAFMLRPGREKRLLGDGGCYGRFARAFLGTTTNAFGAVVGLERLADFVQPSKPSPAANIAILARPEPGCPDHADILTSRLRDAGIAVWDMQISRPLHRHLRDLARLAIPFSIVIGPREVDHDEYTIRDHTGALHTVPAHDLTSWLHQHIAQLQPR